MVVWWLSVFKFPAIAHPFPVVLYAFSWLHICIRLAVNQPEQKLVGIVPATLEEVSLQKKSVSQLSPTAKAKEAIFPPHSDWIANYRLTYVSVNVDLTLAPCMYRTTLERVGSMGVGALWHHFRCFQPAPWLRMATKEYKTNDLHDRTHTHEQADNCNFSIMILL